MEASQTWLVVDTGSSDAAFNMAFDAALLEDAPHLEGPVLRFYSWTEPAASFGYFQRVSEIERLTACRPLVRRPTGGGLVPHAADWTYSVAVPCGNAWYELRADASYERMHRWVQRSLALCNIPAELAPAARKELPGQCFAGFEKSDVLSVGRKIAGAAQRRTKTGLLIQGSVQPPPPAVSRARWQEAMLSAGTELLGARWHSMTPPPDLLGKARQLAADVYSQPGHNARR
jgi:lipoyl(octanoyl) transferase